MSLLTLKKTWPYLIGIAIFIFVISRIDISKTLKLISDTNIIYFVAAILLLIPFYGLKAVRWQYLMKQQDIRYSIRKVIIMYFAAIFIGFITPGRLAELLKTRYLIEDGYSTGKSLFSVFF